MTEEKFWELISLADLNLIDQHKCLEGVSPIIQALTEKPPEDICAFGEIMSKKLYDLDFKHLNDALESGADSFLYQRCYAVVSGYHFYMNTFCENKRRLDTFDWCESLLFVAQKAWYQSKNTDWSFTPSVSYETGSNENGYKLGADFSYKGKDYSEKFSPLLPTQYDTIYQAIRDGNYDTAFDMIEIGADLNIDNPLYAAVEANHLELIATLIEKGANTDQPIVESGGTYITPLALAVMKNKVGIIKSLLAAGATPTAKHGDEFCPLMTACERGNMRIATLLLKAGANPNSQMAGGPRKLKQGSPLFSSINSNKPAMVDLILSYGATPDIWDENRKVTPLADASIFAHYAKPKDVDNTLTIIQSLIDNGANVNILRASQNTLLQSLTGIGLSNLSKKHADIRKRVIELLVKNGAKMNDGTTPSLSS